VLDVLFISRRKCDGLRHGIDGPDQREVSGLQNEELTERGWRERWVDGSEQPAAVAGLVQDVAGQCPEGAQGGVGCALMVGALVTMQVLAQDVGVALDGRVTEKVEEVMHERERADANRSDRAAFHRLVGEQVIDGQVTGALFALALTVDAIGGSPPIRVLH
jgi:hypothetical protein